MSTSGGLPVSISQLHFSSEGHQSLSHVLSDLRRSALSITNRLKSIEEDAAFVESVVRELDRSLPVVANERCGSWYISPDRKGGSAYFKSTDGHTGQWSFSLRRLNLQVLDIASQHGGCIIVDSTRRGKSMPDALSKTIPIWCAVMNKALFPDATAYHVVQFPPDVLSASEESQIQSRINGFVASFETLKLDLNDMKSRLGKPMRISWATRDYIWPEYHDRKDFHHIILCSASRRVHGAEMSEGGYIQGAGDDSEGWSCGLTPPVFWANKDTLLKTAEEDLPALIGELCKKHCEESSSSRWTLIKPTNNIYIGATDCSSGAADAFDSIIDCNADPSSSANPKRLNLGLPTGKMGGRNLRRVLEKIEMFIRPRLASGRAQSVVVTCQNGKDLSAGVALAMICLFYNEQGEYNDASHREPITKQFIRQRLAWIISSKQDVNPSRSTLQSVNSFLMEKPD